MFEFNTLFLNSYRKTEYNEESDSDEGSTKRRRGLLLVRFPFGKRAEYDLKNEQYYKSLDDGDFIVSDDEDIDFYRDDEPVRNIIGVEIYNNFI